MQFKRYITWDNRWLNISYYRIDIIYDKYNIHFCTIMNIRKSTEIPINKGVPWISRLLRLIPPFTFSDLPMFLNIETPITR